MQTIEKDGYLYDPPSWKVCPECGGETKIIYYDDVLDIKYGEYKTKKCPTCAKSLRPGYIPIHYTPDQWVGDGGILTDDTPVWQFINQGSDILRFIEAWGDVKELREGKIIIATSAGKPEEK